MIGLVLDAGKRVLTLVLRTVRPLGWIVLSIAVSAWVVGETLGWIESLTIAGAAAILLLLCAGFLVGRSALEVQMDLRPARVVAGERANGRLAVINRSTSRMRPLRVDLVVGGAVATFDIPSLARGEPHEDLFQIPTTRRGVIQVGPARVVRADPVGLLARVVSHSGSRTLFVHPKAIRVGGAGAGFLRDLEGQASADLSRSDLAFHSLRKYTPGDDRHHVHWKSSAKTGELMVQQFVDIRRAHVLVVLDTERNKYSGSEQFETAVSVVASIGTQTIRDAQALSVVAGHQVLATNARSSLLDGLSGVETSGVIGSLARAMALGARSAPGASLVVIVTGTQTTLAELRAVGRRFGIDTRIAVVLVGETDRGYQTIENMVIFGISELTELPAVVRTAMRT